MDCGVLGAVEVGEECWREGGRVRKVRGQRAAAVVALERRGGMEDKGLKWGGGRGERKMLVIPSVLIAELDGQAERT